LIIQKYVEKPLLVGKKKFDLRVYVLITGFEQMHAFVADEGLARFCTTNYKEPEGKNLKDAFMHLTNFAINKESEDFKNSNDV
jgi:hypothetical protein